MSLLYDGSGNPIGSSGQRQADEIVSAITEQTKTYQEISNTLNDLVRVIHAEAQSEKIAERDQNSQDRRSYVQQWWIFGAQIATFLATTAAFFAAIRYADIADLQRMSSDMQLGILSRQVLVAESANEQSRRLAGQGSLESKAALNASIAASRNDQRAYVATFKFCGENFSGGTANMETCDTETKGVFIARVIFKNTGKTFAVGVKSCIEAQVDRPLDPMGTNCKKQLSGSALISPGAPFAVTTEHLLTDEILAGRQEYISGLIYYQDLFSHQHWTEFCAHTSLHSRVFQPCSAFNDCDDCGQQGQKIRGQN